MRFVPVFCAAALPLFSAAALTLLSAGCSVKDEKGEYFGATDRAGKDPHTFYVNNGNEPEYVDPGKAHDTASSKIINHLFEGLAAYGPDSSPVAGVAERYDRTPDNLYFRFHIRDDAKWNDGKPVTAQDFEYAWKRVLDPKTASQSSTNMYFLKNGELFNQGKLLVAKQKADVREGPGGDAKVTGSLDAGAAALVLTRSPVGVQTTVEPFSEVPAGVDSISYDPADPKTKTPENLQLFSANDKKVFHGGAAGALPAGDYDVVAKRGTVSCNGDKTYYFEVVARDGSGKRGILPGCMLGPAASPPSALLVARWDAMPTFDPQKRIEPAEDPPPVGFVDAGSLASNTSVVGVRAVDDRTLEVEAEFPTPYILDSVAHATSYPVRKDVVEKFEESGEPDMWTRPGNIVTNGPYEIENWKFRYEIRMRRNPHHRLHDKLKMHNIVWMSVESSVSSMNLYKSGELDYVGDNNSLPPPYIPVLGERKDFQHTFYLGTYWYEFNTKVKPLDDVRVRRALNLAVDKQQLIDSITRGKQMPATHFVPPFMGGGYSEAVDKLKADNADIFATNEYSFNPELGRQLLGEAGYKVVKEGDGYRAEGMPPVELLYNTNEGHRAIAVAIQDMWKRNLGVSVQLRNEEWHVMLKNVRDKNFQVVRFGWIADFDHPQTFMDTFMAKSPNNRTGWSSAEFESLVAKARRTADTAESMKLYREAEKILADEVPKLPLYFYSKTTLVKPYVKGFFFNRRNEQLVNWMWIDDNWASNKTNEPAYQPETFPPPSAY
ncbi:MAG: peptide ABC transporter substrate-binding protein [Polyangiaceae bacterium]|nr:peptide ABC transporter substrate-binding protein [Polyangiaceae bacterium]